MVRGRLDGAKLLKKPVAILRYQVFDPFGRIGPKYKTCMMMPVETFYNLRSVVAAGVWAFLPRKTDDASCVEVRHVGQRVLHAEE